MDNPIPHPIGLAILITAAIALLTPGAMEQAGPTLGNGAIAHSSADPGSGETALNRGGSSSQDDSSAPAPFSNHAFTPSIVTALRGEARRSGEPKKQQLWERDRRLELPKELPEDIRTARLMLSVESLFKATTAN